MIQLDRIPHRVAVPALLFVFLLCGFVSLSLDSVTFDETPHLASGVSYWETGDFRLNPEHPPLGKLIAAAPLVLMGRGNGDYTSDLWRGTPLSESAPTRSHAAEWGFGFRLLNGDERARRDPSSRLIPARSMILILAALLGLIVYAWTRALFGPGAGLLALAMAVTCPTLLAHGRLVTTDLPAALGFTATSWLVWRWIGRPSWKRAILSGLALGAALLFKFSCAILAPIIVVIAIAAVVTGRVRVRQAVLGVGTIAAVAYVAVWAGYGFRFAASRDPGYVLEWRDLDADAPPSATMKLAREHHLFPEAYLFGFAYAKSQATQRVSFLDGEQSLAGWYRYFPEAFLWKTPLAFTALALWVLGGALLRTRGGSFDGWCVALPPLVYAAVAVQSRFNIGHRHITPVYPFLCIAIGPAAAWLAGRGARAIAAAALVASCVISFALATPRYLSYFNIAAGGRRGGIRHLVDSNVDWGQDLPRLKSWMDAHGVPEVDLAYFGTGDPAAYGIHFRKLAFFIDFYPELPAVRPERGRYLAASVTLLNGVYMDGERTFARSLLERRIVARSKVEEYSLEIESQAKRGLPLVHIADWMVARGYVTVEQRREIEAEMPAAYLEHVYKTLTPVGWAGDSIAIYRIE